MHRRGLRPVFVTLLLAIAVYGQSAVSGGHSYELYSWKIKGHWYYSLLPQGAAKTYEEITGNRSIGRDSSGLKTELRKLPKGATVIWMSDAPPEAKKPAAAPTAEIKHPSRKRIKHIRSICHNLGIKLRLT